jgi:hypothetical protein
VNTLISEKQPKVNIFQYSRATPKRQQYHHPVGNIAEGVIGRVGDREKGRKTAVDK